HARRAMDDAEIELAIVDLRVGNDANPTAVLPRVADGGEHDLFVARAVDRHVMRRKARQNSDDGVEIDERAAKELHVLIRVARHFRIESKSGNAEVANAV